ncbi:hypothetical protein G6F56_013144 [Rhizopus delemar]|nr:hypothetical protein G6F56_013144 [Rhizopus delemar]
MFESTSTFRCTGGTAWDSLPEQIEFGSILRISGSRGISTGRVILQDATEETPAGTIHLKGMVAPVNALKRVHFTLKRVGDETHLDFQVIRESLVKICVSIEVVVFVAKETQLIHVDLPNVAIQIPVLENADTLQLSTSNSPIVFDSAWKGKRLIRVCDVV